VSLSVEIVGCQGHGKCFEICPEVFRPDVEGYSQDPEGAIPPEYADKVREAEAACPERAIKVSELADSASG
jgi:ferredoxin